MGFVCHVLYYGYGMDNVVCHISPEFITNLKNSDSMFQFIFTIIIVLSASIYAFYKLYRAIIPGKHAAKRGCPGGCPHCMQ